jgi:aminopeptidase N
MSENYYEDRRLFNTCCAHRILGRPGHLEPHSVPWARANYRTDRNCKPLAQLLEIDLDVKGKTLRGKNTIEIEFIRGGSNHFSLNAADLKIEKVLWDDQVVKFREKDEEVLISLPRDYGRGQKGKVCVEYSVTDPRAGIYFIAPDKEYPKRDVQVWTQGQDDDARYWFPCFDEPGIKFISEMKITAPSGFICTSNGKLMSEDRSGTQWKFHWKMTLPIPSYLVTLTAGKFLEIKDTWRDVPVHYLVENGRETEAKISFGKTPKMMELFSQKLGVPYPYEKYHQIAVSEFVFGGMENTSATTQTDATLHPINIEPDFTSDDLVSHELAHQWFGDLVTCHSWSHGWLNESWATFMETVFKENDLSQNDAHYYRYEELQIYLGEDTGLYRRALVTNIYSDPAEIWDRHLYQKGGLILNMLRAEIGEEDFWKGTELYLKTHQGQGVETIDFQRALEKTCQRPLDWFFDQWIYKGGHPDLKVTYDWDAKNKLAKVKFEQTQKKDSVTPIHRINSLVEFHYEKKEIKRVPVTIDSNVKHLVIPMESEPMAIRFDTDNSVLKTVSWELPEKMILHQLQLENDIVGKIWAMKSLQKKATLKGQEALIERLNSDPFWGVRKEAALALGKITSQKAFFGLLDALRDEKDSRVRGGIASALGNWRTEQAFVTLSNLAFDDTHEFVQKSAAEALGKTKSPKAYDALIKLLEKPSWRDQLRSGAFRGLKNLGDDRAVDVIMEGSRYGSPKWARPFGASALGSLGLNRKDVDSFLVDLLKDPFPSVRYKAMEAIEERNQTSAVSDIDMLAHQTVDGHLKFAAHLTAKRLRKGEKEKEEVKNMRESIEKLVKENGELKDRMEVLEERLNGASAN